MRLKYRRTIRRTLTFYFAIFALIPLSIVVLVALNAVSQSAYEQAASQRQLAIEVRFADIERLMLNAESAIELILVEPAQAQRVLSLVTEAGLPSSSRPITIRNVERALRQQLESQDYFSRIFIYNISGEIIVSTDDADNEGTVRDEVFFAAGRSNTTMLHASTFHRVHNRPEIFVTTPVFNEEGRVVGHVAGQLDFAVMDALLLAPLGSKTSQIYLVDATRTLVSPNSEALPAGTVLSSNGIRAALRNSSGATSYINHAGIPVIGAYRFIPELQLGLIAEIEESEAFAVSTQIQNLSIAVSVMALIGVIVVGFVGAQQLTQPIAVLTETAAAVIAGDLSQRANITANNEIGQLANSFNQMTDRLNNLINTLEQRITERTKELVVARQQAEDASQAKSVFLSNMSHELRTPLNMVIGYTSSMLNMPQMYAGNELPPIFRDDVRLIQQNGQHLLGLINDILDLSKIEAGKFALHFAATDINDIFKGVMATSVGLVSNKPIQLRADYANDLPKVWGDQQRIRQILLNLLSNAIKFTNAGVVTLHAHFDEQRLYVAIKDTGVGIPREALATIFDRFEQGQQDATIQGTGLGLDISQRLAQMHGSTIEIESEVGKGSTFSFSLPLVQPEFLAIPQTLPNVEPSIVTLSPDEAVQHRVVLLAETNGDMRQLIHEKLENHNYVIVDIQEGDDLAEYAATLAPDVIVISGNFASEATFELIEGINLQEDSKNIPILVLSERNLSYPSNVQVIPPAAGNLLESLEAVFNLPI